MQNATSWLSSPHHRWCQFNTDNCNWLLETWRSPWQTAVLAYTWALLYSSENAKGCTQIPCVNEQGAVQAVCAKELFALWHEVEQGQNTWTWDKCFLVTEDIWRSLWFKHSSISSTLHTCSDAWQDSHQDVAAEGECCITLINFDGII